MPARKPVVLKLLAGNPGKRRLPQARPPAAPADAMQPPANLDADAAAIWRAECPEMQSRGLMAAIFSGDFASYCTQAAKLARLERELVDAPFTVAGAKGRKQVHPMHRLTIDLHKQILAMRTAFGLTPASWGKASDTSPPRPKPAAGEKTPFDFDG